MGRTRLGLVAVAVALLALTGLSGCDAGRPPAAKVGQTEISSATLIDDLDAEAARAAKIGSDSSPAKEVDGTYSASAAAELLGRRIRYVLLGEVLAARDITVTQEERDLAEQTLCQGGSSTQVQGCPGLEGYPKAYREYQIELTARGNAYSTAISEQGGNEDELRKTYDDLKESDPDQLAVRCYTGATITDPASVEQIQVRVAGGADFADAVEAVEGTAPTAEEQCASVSVFPRRSSPPRRARCSGRSRTPRAATSSCRWASPAPAPSRRSPPPSSSRRRARTRRRRSRSSSPRPR